MKFGIAKVGEPWGPSRKFAEAINSNEFAKTSKFVKRMAKLTPHGLAEFKKFQRASGVL